MVAFPAAFIFSKRRRIKPPVRMQVHFPITLLHNTPAAAVFFKEIDWQQQETAAVKEAPSGGFLGHTATTNGRVSRRPGDQTRSPSSSSSSSDFMRQ
jgi:hypothetical protein